MTESKKIAQVVYTGFGGLGSVAFSLVAADTHRSHEWIIGFVGDQPIDLSYPPRCEQYGMEWAAFQTTTRWPYLAWVRLAIWLIGMRPDTIIVHSISSIVPSRLAAWVCGARVVAVEHLANNVKRKKAWIFSRIAMRLADRVVVLTPEYKDDLAVALGSAYRQEKVVEIPNGIDTDCFRPPNEKAPGGTKVRLGMAARFSFSKRQDLLVGTILLLCQNHPHIDWRLSLAGDGDRFLDVQKLISSHGLADRISLEGNLPEQDVASWMRDLDIYVHASDGETLSTSLLQAMATGLPIIASDVPGISNLLGHDDGLGVLVKNDVQSFADAVGALAMDHDEQIALGKRAREACAERYSHTAMLQSYLKIVEPSPARKTA